jgi:hypothetical protein
MARLRRAAGDLDATVQRSPRLAIGESRRIAAWGAPPLRCPLHGEGGDGGVTTDPSESGRRVDYERQVAALQLSPFRPHFPFDARGLTVAELGERDQCRSVRPDWGGLRGLGEGLQREDLGPSWLAG